jgi:hypothetical protein
MRAVWIFYIFLGIAFVFFVYMVTLGSYNWWFMVYYIILGFLGVLALFYPQTRWWFILGLILGTLLAMYLESKGILEKGHSFLPF